MTPSLSCCCFVLHHLNNKSICCPQGLKSQPLVQGDGQPQLLVQLLKFSQERNPSLPPAPSAGPSKLLHVLSHSLLPTLDYYNISPTLERAACGPRGAEMGKASNSVGEAEFLSAHSERLMSTIKLGKTNPELGKFVQGHRG